MDEGLFSFGVRGLTERAGSASASEDAGGGFEPRWHPSADRERT
jgi:hypothetical protein